MTSAAGGGREDHIAALVEPGTRLVREGFYFFYLCLNDVLLCGLVDDGKEGRSLFPELRVYM